MVRNSGGATLDSVGWCYYRFNNRLVTTAPRLLRSPQSDPGC